MCVCVTLKTLLKMMRKITSFVRFGKKLLYICKILLQSHKWLCAVVECEAGNLGDTGSRHACVSAIFQQMMRGSRNIKLVELYVIYA
jgi:hypothetical protein